MGRESLRKITVDESFHINTNALREAIEADLREGNTPCAIIGAAGATSTGIVDPLDALAQIAGDYDLWFHVDAAYGGALIFSEKYRSSFLKGIELADSVTIDPHKWVFVPFECGAALVRGDALRTGRCILRDAFDIVPAYLSEDRAHFGRADVEYDLFRYGQLGTRRFMALKIWMALKFLGVGGYAGIIERQIDLTKYFAARIDELEDFVRVGEVETAVCCFRFLPQSLISDSSFDAERQDRLQQDLQQRIERGGEAWISTTILNRRRALRVNINSFLTERRHVDALVELLRREGRAILEEGD